MKLNVPVKPLGLVILGVVIGIGLAVGPRHVHWPAPEPAPAPPAPPKPAPRPFPSTDDGRPSFPSTRLEDPTLAEDRECARLCGWTPNHPGRPAVQASIPTLYRAAGPDLAADRSKSVLLYKLWREVFRDYPHYPAQQIGDCESFGHGHAHDLLQTIEAYLGDLDASAIGRTCTEAWYAAGRESARMLGWQDGCYGSAMLKAAQTTGVLRYADLPDNMREYSGRRAKAWGRTGLPWDLAQVAAGRRLQGAMLQSVDDMIGALQAGHPCTVSTALGFEMTRDRQGFCRPSGSWGHCMACVAYRADRPGFLILQSWGPDQPTGPTDLDQPSWSFWCDLAVMERIIAEGDSDTLSATPGFAPRALPGSITSLS